MRLKDIEWGCVFNASGARGFYGEGYWYHRLPIGLDYKDSVFVAKTTTLYARAGNMPLNNDTQAPKEFKPKCIIVRPLKGVVLNAVGLSGPGADCLIDKWCEPDQNPGRNGQWMVSFMSVAGTPEERVGEAKRFFEKLPKLILDNGRINTGLQINLSCPNVGLDPSTLVDEGRRTLDLAESLGVAVLVKLNALVPPKAAKALADHPNCDGLIVSNTIPWGKLPEEIDWKGLFGTTVSPLAHLGGGGLSGAPLLPIVAKWVFEARKAGLSKPIIGGGGILGYGDAERLLDVGADGVELGSVSILRPWRVRSIIDYVNTRTRY